MRDHFGDRGGFAAAAESERIECKVSKGEADRKRCLNAARRWKLVCTCASNGSRVGSNPSAYNRNMRCERGLGYNGSDASIQLMPEAAAG